MINIIGTIFGCQGYDVHTRELANALCKITDVRLSTQLPNGWERMVNDNELLMIKTPPKEDEINLLITMPHMWKMNLGKRNWGYCVWEGSKIPESYIEEFLNPEIEYIIVPSNHTKQAIENTTKDKNILEKIKIIPHGVDLNKFRPEPTKHDFTFLVNKGFRNLEDRGGMQYAIRAYLDEFKPKEKVKLILKVNPAYGTPNLLQLFPELKEPTPKIEYDTQLYDYKKLINLYNKADVLVAPTRAEAFNLPCLEAMACGLPVITTGYGGQIDFVNKDNGWLIDYDLKPVEHEIMYEGINWATPRIKVLRKAMREAFEEDLQKKKEKAIETAKEMTWEKTAKIFVEMEGSNPR